MARRQRSPLTERDEEVLVSLYRYGYLTTSQIRRLHFPSVQTTRRRLLRLQRLGYVASMQSTGMLEQVCTLMETGARVVADGLGVTVQDMQWDVSQSVTEVALRHRIDVAEFRIALTTECAARRAPQLLAFLPVHVKSEEVGTRRRQIAIDVAADVYDPRGSVGHAPDAAFALAPDGVPRLFFLEIDRHLGLASDAKRSVRHLVDFYDGYWATGAFHPYEKRLGLEGAVREFRVLLVVNSKQRLKAIQALVEDRVVVRRSEHFIWLAERQILDGRPILSAPWIPLRAVRGERCTLDAATTGGVPARARGRSGRREEGPANNQARVPGAASAFAASRRDVSGAPDP